MNSWKEDEWMDTQETSKPNLIYSPEYRIPLFEAVTTETGARAIRVKRNKIYEVVTLDTLLALILKDTDPKPKSRVPRGEGTRL